MARKSARSAAVRGFTNLQHSPVVMAWRRVTNLDNASRFASGVANWPKVGQNQYAQIFDAGTVLVGYWVQDRFVDAFVKDRGVSRGSLTEADMAAADFNCCRLNFDRFALVSNPANQFVLGSTNLTQSMRQIGRTYRIGSERLSPRTGGAISLVDEDGNVFDVRRMPASVGGRAGSRVKQLLRTHGTSSRRGGRAARRLSPLVGYDLLVSDLRASLRFYRDVLGLRSLGSSARQARFDLGSVVLTLSAEPALGLVRSLSRAQRLDGDWFMFHVPDVDAAFSTLKKRGVSFPSGIEESGHGRGALFRDPDGHLFSVWEPPSEPVDIDYFKVLNRLLKAA